MKSLLSRFALALIAFVTLAPAAAAQTVFNACYVPSIGAVYMINRAGLPANCLTAAHVAITWTDGGVADGGVTTVKLADGNVTTIKIADLAVATAKLADASVTTAKLAAGSVTAAKLGADVTAAILSDGSVTIAKLSFDPATQAELDAYKTSLAAAGTVNTPTNPIDYSQLKNVPASAAGDITSVVAGTGLTGGGTTGDVTLAVAYDGPGGANTAARSDHTHRPSSNNVAVGQGALQSVTGDQNAVVGHEVLMVNTGSWNSALGFRALRNNSTGFENVAVGRHALFANTTGGANTAVGYDALRSNSTSGQHVALGAFTLANVTTGVWNTALGESAMFALTAGTGNIGIGQAALLSLTTGDFNIAIGREAGTNLTTGMRNIYIGNTGVASEMDRIRIGNNGHIATFIGGIRGITTGVANAIPVVVDSDGQLGTVSSSARFKEDISDMGDASRGLLALRPVQFRYKQASKDGSKPLQYGLVAEEVAQTMPRLVDFDSTGTPTTVYYHLLPAMLLNEIQRQERELTSLRKSVAALEAAVAALQAKQKP